MIAFFFLVHICSECFSERMLQYFGGDLASCFATWIRIIFCFNEPLFMERIGHQGCMASLESRLGTGP